MYSFIMCCMLFACSVSSTIKAIRKRSDDINLPELQHVIQQQSAVIQTLQAKVTPMDNTMKQQSAVMQTLQTKVTSMDNTMKQQSAVMQTLQTKVTSMDNTMKQQSAVMQTLQSKLMKHVAFTVNTYGSREGNISSREVIKFNNIITNSGSGYSAATGVFTASVAGNYGFYLSIRHNYPNAWIVVALEKNGKELCYAVAQDGNEETNDTGACFATSHLNVGDKVLARQNDGDTNLELWRFTTFSGFLLLAD